MCCQTYLISVTIKILNSLLEQIIQWIQHFILYIILYYNSLNDETITMYNIYFISGKYISALMMCTSTMYQMELPHVNILSKIDIAVKHKSKLLFNLDYYTDVLSLDQLLNELQNDPHTAKYVHISNYNFHFNSNIMVF